MNAGRTPAPAAALHRMLDAADAQGQARALAAVAGVVDAWEGQAAEDEAAAAAMVAAGMPGPTVDMLTAAAHERRARVDAVVSAVRDALYSVQ